MLLVPGNLSVQWVGDEVVGFDLAEELVVDGYEGEEVLGWGGCYGIQGRI